MNLDVKVSGVPGYDFCSGTVSVDNDEIWDNGVWLHVIQDDDGSTSRLILSQRETRKLAKKLLKAAGEIERRDGNGEA